MIGEMMKALTLNKLAIACTLVLGLTACGGSDGGSSTNNQTNQNNTGNQTTPNNPANPTTPANPNTSANDLAKAKDLINTAKTFVTDSKTVSDAYENASGILNDKQSQRIEAVLNIPSTLQKWMQDNRVNSLTAQKVKEISTRPTGSVFIDNIYSDLDHSTLEPSSDFSAKLDNQGNLTLTGSIKVKKDNVYYSWDPVINDVKMEVVDSDEFSIVYKNLTAKLVNTTASRAYTGTYGFDEVAVFGNNGADEFKLKAQAKLTASFNKNVAVDKDFDLPDEQEKGLTLQQAVATFSNVTLTTKKDTIAVNNMEISALDIENTIQGDKVVKTIPYSFKLTGKLTRAEPKTDLDLTLNLVAKDSAVKDALTIKLDEDEYYSDTYVEEKAGKYLPATALLSIKGNVVKTNNASNAVTIPLNFQANLERTSRTNINLKNLTATVNGKTLNVVGSTTFNNDYDTIKQTFTFSQQGGASLTIHVNEDDELVKVGNKIADITVNGKDYGDLLDNNGKITAKFSDNTTIAL